MKKLLKSTAKILKERVPFGTKRRIERFSVGLVRSVFQTSGAALDLSSRFLLNFERELPPNFANLLRLINSPDAGRGFGLNDFLLLAENQTPLPSQTVKVSIIIPVFNKAEFTFQCLRSLLREIDLTQNEIIVVNNASSDETARLLDLLRNHLCVIHNGENKGFVEACNQGAAIARGEFLVFLNNDTVVESQWLKAMVETIENDKTVGAVGSKLVYPDGRLQEAGCIIWQDGYGHAYGWGQNPQDARFNFAREVDYCSGASLLIKKELFEQIGGFDMRYAPAYYEDTDLCMSVRAAGYKVVYQPASRLMHFESVTAGKDKQTGFRRFLEINREKFVAKWRETLEREHLSHDKKNVNTASNRKTGRRIMVFHDLIPQPDVNSGGVRMFAVLQALSKLGQVTSVPLTKRPGDEKYEQMLGKTGVEVVWINDFLKRAKREQVEVAILTYPFVAELMFTSVKKMFPAAKMIFDTVDVHFVRLEREFELTKNPTIAREAARFKKIEMRWAKAADEVWCVTENDREFLQKVVPTANIEIVPNIHALQGRGKPFAERTGLFFIGGFQHRPNLDAVIYFLDEIFPLLLEKQPALQFHIAGSSTPPEIFARNSANVTVHGFVPDVSKLFQNSRVFVSPLRYGAGMKGKIGQSLSFGLPVVTTSVGAEGMSLTNGAEVLIADAPQQFADAVWRVYCDEVLWQTLSDAGYNFIEQNFSPATVQTMVDRAVNKLFDDKPPRLSS